MQRLAQLEYLNSSNNCKVCEWLCNTAAGIKWSVSCSACEDQAGEDTKLCDVDKD